MKKIIQILLIGCLLLVLGGCQGKTQYTTATPEGTVRLLLKYLSETTPENSEMNAEKIAQLWIEPEREMVRADLVRIFKEEFDSFTFSNIKIEEISQTDDTAKVLVQSDVTIIRKPTRSPSKILEPKHKDGLFLVKRNGKWLLERGILV